MMSTIFDLKIRESDLRMFVLQQPNDDYDIRVGDTVYRIPILLYLFEIMHRHHEHRKELWEEYMKIPYEEGMEYLFTQEEIAKARYLSSFPYETLVELEKVTLSVAYALGVIISDEDKPAPMFFETVAEESSDIFYRIVFYFKDPLDSYVLTSVAEKPSS